MSPRPISILHREADHDLVAYCERLLERARAGIVGLVVAAELPGGEFLILRHGDFAVLPMVGELELVQHRLLTLEEH